MADFISLLSLLLLVIVAFIEMSNYLGGQGVASRQLHVKNMKATKSMSILQRVKCVLDEMAVSYVENAEKHILSFEVNGTPFQLENYDEEEFFHLTLSFEGNFGDKEMITMEKVALKVCNECPMVKMSVKKDSVTFSAEAILSPNDDVEALFKKSIDLLPKVAQFAQNTTNEVIKQQAASSAKTVEDTTTPPELKGRPSIGFTAARYVIRAEKEAC